MVCLVWFFPLVRGQVGKGKEKTWLGGRVLKGLVGCVVLLC